MTNVHDLSAATIDGAAKPLRDYAGKALLIVNVASQCGLTPQYAGLQKLYEPYLRSQGFWNDGRLPEGTSDIWPFWQLTR